MASSKYSQLFSIHSYWLRWFGLSMLTGLVAGLAAIVFQLCVQVVQYVALVYWVGYHPGEPAGDFQLFEAGGVLNVWMILPVITLGGLLTGLIVFRFAPEAEGHGTDAVIDAFHNRRGVIPLRIPIVKVIASAITLGTGGSAGKEGPIAQTAAGFGSFLAQRLHLPAHDRRILMVVGMGAGIGAIFRAPLAGAIFAGEILYRDGDIESEVIVPTAIASTIAYTVFQLSLPHHLRFSPLFGRAIEHELGSILELIPYTFLAFALIIAAALYCKTFYATTAAFKRIPILPHFKPAIGAFLTGLISIGLFFLFQQDHLALAPMGSGYGFLQHIFDDVETMAIPLLFAVAGAKILTTSLTIGSGGSGGVFGPSMVIGGSVGAGVGRLVLQWYPEIGGHPGAFAIIGMAGFFAACANAPLSTILMVSEITGDYKLLLPALWVSSICFIVCRKWSIYSEQVDSRIDSPAHLGDFSVDLLAGIRVQDVYQSKIPKITFHEQDSLDTIVHSLARSSQRYFLVYNSSEELVGIFSVEDVRRYLYDDSIWRIANARDIMTEKVVTLQLDDDLNYAMGQFTVLNVDELPVVSCAPEKKVIGVCRRKETIAAYNMKRLEIQRRKDEESSE